MYLGSISGWTIVCFFWVCSCTAAIIVDCVGDSITYGDGTQNNFLSSYPAKLQLLLGTNYLIHNLGYSGTTLLKNGDSPYWKSPVFNYGTRIASSIVIIMLGSNDSKPQNWAYGTNFYANYQSLIAAYTNTARILICTPPPVFGTNGYTINGGIVATNISPVVRQLGCDENLQMIDMQLLLAGDGEWFPDNVHPNETGTEVMAAIVYTALIGDTMNGVAPGLGITQNPSGEIVLNWPAGGAGWVLQSKTVGSNSWSVVSQRVVNDGTFTKITNSVTRQNTLFRLWNPVQ